MMLCVSLVNHSMLINELYKARSIFSERGLRQGKPSITLFIYFGDRGVDLFNPSISG
jgi:hypothetical protein